MKLRSFLLALLCAPALASAVTYQVGPGRTYTQLSQVASLVNPGDVVQVDGNATYNGVAWTRNGTAAQPITIRGTVGGAQRPVINAGGSADAFRMDVNHYVVEDMVISNASTRCVYLRGTNLTLRRVTVHTCLKHGILGSDSLTGDMTLTEVEVYNQGNSAAPSGFDHPIYIATDLQAYPDAVLLIEKSWIHDNFSGNGIKSRAKRLRAIGNWIETTNGMNHTIEAIGPDPSGAPALCPIPNGSNDADLCTADIVGNVLLARGNNANMMRLGSDGTGDSYGRYHIVNNTFVANDVFATNSAAMIRAFGNLQSIELHNNIFWYSQGDQAASFGGIRIVRDAEATWVNGRRVTGTKNLISAPASVYASGIAQASMQGLTNTIFTTESGVFANANLASPGTLDLRLVAASPARRAGNAGNTSTPGYQIPNPLNLPLLQPPRMRPDPGSFVATNRPAPTDDNGTALPGQVSLGAFEYTVTGSGNVRVTVNKSGTGSGTVTSAPGTINCGATCFTDVTTGTPITLTAAAAVGSIFTGWSGGGCSGAGPTCAFPASAATTVTATFALLAGAPTPITNNPGLDFGGQSVQTTSLPRTVWFSNGGTGTITVSGASSNLADFAVTNGCTNVGSGQTCPITVAFTPTTTSPRNATLTINTTAGSPTFAMTGQGELSLVTHFYQAILNREPDASGKSYWQGEATRMSGLGANINETWFVMSGYFFNSAEYVAANKNNNAFVTDLYNTFFNRSPDAGGLNYWVGQINGGLPREVVLFSFMFSPEFATFTQGIFGNTAARPEVNVVMDFFRGILNRLPDTSSFNFWLGRLRTAQCQGANAVYAEIDSMSSAFIFNAEYSNRQRNTTQFVTDMYYSFLRRGGDLQGVQFWVNQLNTGTKTTNTVRSDFIATPEFATRVQAVVNAGCIQ